MREYQKGLIMSNLKTLKRISSEFRKGLIGDKSPTMMCFAVSSALGSYLHICGFNSILTEGKIFIVTSGEVHEYQHFWLTLPDGNILDATADQFNNLNGHTMPPVYVGIKPEWYKER
jgi:hypothetical protein